MNVGPAVGDFNRDGIPDLAYVQDNQLTDYLNTGFYETASAANVLLNAGIALPGKGDRTPEASRNVTRFDNGSIARYGATALPICRHAARDAAPNQPRPAWRPWQLLRRALRASLERVTRRDLSRWPAARKSQLISTPAPEIPPRANSRRRPLTSLPKKRRGRSPLRDSALFCPNFAKIRLRLPEPSFPMPPSLRA